ncbi:hypothetical protein E1301_Tti018375 [Triplophysa tibetana]|uniref:Uncharacterized protein n=1 Tax=Triplophysa tibetana TaxID=1572043 RepID=A0A5A9N820_9TELE|nr:hypothetical protein E1301_Tti023368 [Triplophysa tibetana]KAA0706092.1 hypothetical protein E1301_Tti018375 [Triplophysa tibetana]
MDKEDTEEDDDDDDDEEEESTIRRDSVALKGSNVDVVTVSSQETLPLQLTPLRQQPEM